MRKLICITCLVFFIYNVRGQSSDSLEFNFSSYSYPIEKSIGRIDTIFYGGKDSIKFLHFFNEKNDYVKTIKFFKSGEKHFETNKKNGIT